MKIIEFFKAHRKAAMLTGLALAAAGAFLFTNLTAGAKQEDTYETEAAARGSLTASVGATGSLRANQSAVLTWKAGGTVADVHFNLGDSAPADAILAGLDPASTSQNLILAEADLVSAQKALEDLLNSDTSQAQAVIALREAQEDYEDAEEYRLELNERVEYEIIRIITIRTPVGTKRIPHLKTIKYYPDEEEKREADEKLALAAAKLEDAQRTYDRLKDGPNPDDLAAARARVTAAQATLNQAKIVAPFPGVITDAKPLPGDIVTAGQAAFRLDDLSRLLVEVEVSEVDINRVALGQPASVTFDAVQGKTYHGKVAEVGAVGTSTSGAVNFNVSVVLTDPDEQVRPGMTAAVEIEVINLNDVLLVPNRAVRTLDGERVVYILEDGQPVPVVVHLGASSDSYSQVTGGDLQEGSLIILNPPATPIQPGPGSGGGNLQMLHP